MKRPDGACRGRPGSALRERLLEGFAETLRGAGEVARAESRNAIVEMVERAAGMDA